MAGPEPISDTRCMIIDLSLLKGFWVIIDLIKYVHQSLSYTAIDDLTLELVKLGVVLIFSR